MKKVCAWIMLVLMVFALSCWCIPVALAEEEPAEEAIEQEVVQDAGEQEVVDSEAMTKEEAEAVVKEAIEQFLGQYMENSMVAKIVTWMVDAGVLSALVVIYMRYRKVKNKTIEDVVVMAKDKLSDAATKTFSSVSNEINPQIFELNNKIIDLQYKLNAVLQAFALAQDKSAEGRIAMLQLISRAAEADDKTLETIAEIENDVKQEAEEVAAVEETVQEEYEPTKLDIF